jgi:hypothetical protein
MLQRGEKGCKIILEEELEALNVGYLERIVKEMVPS